MQYYFNPPEINENSIDIAKRVGHDSIVMRLIEIGCFNRSDKSHIESVRSIDTIEGLRIISLKNAGL